MSAAPSPRARALPPLAYVLAAFGIVLGGVGTFSAFSTFTNFLQPRDAYVLQQAKVSERLLGLASEAGERDANRKLVERVADAQYSRRNAALPLAGMQLILSFLLLVGCMRAMRGLHWGWSAWVLAASLSIPYQLLSFGFSVVQQRELRAIFAERGPPYDGSASVVLLGFAMLAGVQILYFGACALYLRQPRMRRLFGDGAGPTPAA